jgi:hypothetical protein
MLHKNFAQQHDKGHGGTRMGGLSSGIRIEAAEISRTLDKI